MALCPATFNDVHLHCSPKVLRWQLVRICILLIIMIAQLVKKKQKEMVSLLSEYLTCHVASEIFVKQYLEVEEIWREIWIGPYFIHHEKLFANSTRPLTIKFQHQYLYKVSWQCICHFGTKSGGSPKSLVYKLVELCTMCFFLIQRRTVKIPVDK